MLQIAIEGLSTSLVHAIAARLRGATLRSTTDSTAVLLLGDTLPEVSTLEKHLREGKQVVIPPTADLPRELLANSYLRIMNPDRYLPSRQLIRQQLDAGKLGEPGLLRMHRWQPPGTDHAAALLRSLDLASWYFGKTPSLVYAVANAGVQVHLGFAGGGMALLDLVHDLPSSQPYHALSVIGSTGAAYADDHANMQILFHSNSILAERAHEGVPALTALVQDFVDTAADPSASTWRDVLASADAVRQSVTSKQAVALKGDA